MIVEGCIVETCILSELVQFLASKRLPDRLVAVVVERMLLNWAIEVELGFKVMKMCG